MGNTTETILLQIDVVANTARVAELRKEILENAKAVAALTKGYDEGRVSIEMLAVGQTKYGLSTKAAQQEISVLTHALQAQDDANKAAAGSGNQLVAQSKLLTSQVNALSAEEKKTEGGQALVAQLKKVNAELITAGKNVSDGRRSVGLYGESLKQTSSVSEKAAAGLDKLSGTASRLPGPLGSVVGGLAETGKGLLSATKAALAFIATPLGAFLALITGAFYALKTAFTSSEEGQNKYAKLMAVIGTVLGNLVDLAAAAGEKLIGVFEHPIESAKALESFLEKNIINRFVGLLELLPRVGTAISLLFRGEFAAAGKVAADAVGKVTLGVNSVTDSLSEAGGALKKFAKENIDEGNAAAKAQEKRNLAVRLERELKLESAATDSQIAELQLKAREKEKFSAQEREAALLKAQALQDGLFAKEKKILELRRDAQIVQNTFSRTNIEDLGKEADARADVIRVEAKRLDARRANVRLLNSLNAEEAATQKAAAAAAAEARQQAAQNAIKDKIAEQNTILLTVKRGGAEELAAKEEIIKLQADLEAVGAKKSAADRRLIEAKYLLDIETLEEESTQKRLENAAKFLADGDNQRIKALANEKARKEEANREIDNAYKADEAMLNRYLDRRRVAIEESYAEGQVDKKAYDKQIELLDETSYGAHIVLAKHYGKDTAKLEADQAKAHRTVLVKMREDEEKLNESRLKSAEAFGQQVGQLFADSLTETGQSLQDFAGKVLVLILDQLEKVVLAQQAAATAQALAQPDSVATFGATGVIRAGIINGLIIAAFETAKGVISAGALKFNTGGLVPGQGSTDTVPAMLTPGESVMNARATQEYGPVLGYLNSMAGGVNFAPGFTPRPAAQIDGGLAARTVAGAPTIDYDQLAASMSKVNLNVGVRTIQAAEQKYNAPRARTSLN